MACSQGSRQEAWDTFQAYLPRITKADMPDLLHIACAHSARCLEALLQHDRDCMHFLHSPQTPGSVVAAQHDEPLQLLTEMVSLAATERQRQQLWLLCQVPLAQCIGKFTVLHV